MWRNFVKVAALTVLFVLPITAKATLISDITTETVSEYISVTNDRNFTYAWNSGYDISFENQDLIIDVDIFLTGFTPSDSLVNAWETGIESIWNNTWDIFDGTYLYDIVFNVDWVSSRSAADHTVVVYEGNGNVNLEDWYTGNPSGWGYSNQGRVAAHEFGHMLGLPDEYSGGATIPGTNRYASIMGGGLSTVHDDHFSDFVDWLSLRSGVNNLSLQASIGDNFYDASTPVPAPAVLVLFLTAVGLMSYQRRS